MNNRYQALYQMNSTAEGKELLVKWLEHMDETMLKGDMAYLVGQSQTHAEAALPQLQKLAAISATVSSQEVGYAISTLNSTKSGGGREKGGKKAKASPPKPKRAGSGRKEALS
jgi:hypothetical protein